MLLEEKRRPGKVHQQLDAIQAERQSPSIVLPYQPRCVPHSTVEGYDAGSSLLALTTPSGFAIAWTSLPKMHALRIFLELHRGIHLSTRGQKSSLAGSMRAAYI